MLDGEVVLLRILWRCRTPVCTLVPGHEFDEVLARELH